MASEPVIIAAADLHVDAEAVGGWDAENNRHSNWTESFRQLNAIVDLANETSADYVVIAGDTYHTGRPKAEAVKLTTEALDRLETAKAVIVPGNHEQQAVFSTHRTPVEAYLSEHRNVLHVASEPEVFEHEGVQFALVPWSRVAGVAKLNETSMNLGNTIERLGEQITGSGPSMFASHIVVDEATFDSGRRSSELTMVTTTLEASVPTSLIDAGPWAIARLGHIHKRQQLSDKTGYVGSPYKVSFGERNDAKGVDVIRFDAKGRADLTFHRLDVREMIQADLTGDSGLSAKVIAEEARPGDLVRFIIDHDEEPKGFGKALKELAKKGVTPSIIRQPKERIEGGRRDAALALDVDPVTAFKVYAERQGIAPAEADRLQSVFLDAISERA